MESGGSGNDNTGMRFPGVVQKNPNRLDTFASRKTEKGSKKPKFSNKNFGVDLSGYEFC
ncbi:MAG: hypothetical protein Tsb009_04490 [Planctomycetaceae bacterium]